AMATANRAGAHATRNLTSCIRSPSAAPRLRVRLARRLLPVRTRRSIVQDAAAEVDARLADAFLARVGEPAIGLRAPAAERTAAAAGRGDARHPRAVPRVNGFAAQHALGGADALVADVDLRPRDQ